MRSKAFAAARIAEMLAPIARVGASRRKLRRGAGRCSTSTIDLVILSLSLATVDRAAPRLAVARQRELAASLPILLIADDGELPRLAKGLDLGANDYLLRPVDRNELLARVRTQVRRKRLQDRLQENYQNSLSLALTDELTGLYNRRYLIAHLEGLLARVAEGGNGAVAADVRHRLLQAGQRHVRSSGRRRGAARGGRPRAARTCAASISSRATAARNSSS